MPRQPPRRSATDDPVVDWGPDAGQGLFDPVEVTGTGESTAAEVTRGDVRPSREITSSSERERPMAVLAWIGATLRVTPEGRSSLPPGRSRGEVPGLAELLANEPLELLPGGFFPQRALPSGADEPGDEADEIGPNGGIGAGMRGERGQESGERAQETEAAAADGDAWTGDDNAWTGDDLGAEAGEDSEPRVPVKLDAERAARRDTEPDARRETEPDARRDTEPPDSPPPLTENVLVEHSIGRLSVRPAPREAGAWPARVAALLLCLAFAGLIAARSCG